MKKIIVKANGNQTKIDFEGFTEDEMKKFYSISFAGTKMNAILNLNVDAVYPYLKTKVAQNKLKAELGGEVKVEKE